MSSLLLWNVKISFSKVKGFDNFFIHQILTKLQHYHHYDIKFHFQIGPYIQFLKMNASRLLSYEAKLLFSEGVAECRYAATSLSSYSINTTLRGFQKRYISLLYLKGLKSYQEKCKWKVRFTKESGVKCRHLNFESW